MAHSCPQEEVRHRSTGGTAKAWPETRRPVSKRTWKRGQAKCVTLVTSRQDWSANPLFERKDNKKEALLDLDGRVANLNKRYAAVKDAGVRIQAMVAVRRPWGRVENPSHSKETLGGGGVLWKLLALCGGEREEAQGNILLK